MKNFILNVTCINDNFQDAPSCVVATLRPSEISKIKELSAFVKDNNILSLKILSSAGAYCQSHDIETLTTEYDLALTEINEASLFDFQTDNTRMELKQIEIYKDSFRFKATPKHCGDGEICKSNKVWLSKLDNSNNFNSLTN